MPSASKTTLPSDIFAAQVPNHELLKIAYNSYLANSRQSAPGVKTRGLVSGGGIKPWRQKGTGRARVGSNRSPIWRGGGIIFGPTGNENHRLKLSKTSKRIAVRQALTLANQAKKIFIDDIKFTGKTKDIASYLQKSGYSDKRVILVVDDKTDEMIRATNNIPNVTLLRGNYLNVFSILNADVIIFSKASLVMVSQWLGSEEAK